MRSAPETIDLSAFHCQIVNPSAAPSAPRLSVGTSCARAQRAPSMPTIRTNTAPPSSAISGESPAKSMCGPFRCVDAITGEKRGTEVTVRCSQSRRYWSCR